jgi:hypothetical protein
MLQNRLLLGFWSLLTSPFVVVARVHFEKAIEKSLDHNTIIISACLDSIANAMKDFYTRKARRLVKL